MPIYFNYSKKIILKILIMINIFILSNIAIAGQAVLPPKYLQVKDFKLCFSTKNMGTWEAWCMPSEKPVSCPNNAWKQLKALKQKDRVPSC